MNGDYCIMKNKKPFYLGLFSLLCLMSNCGKRQNPKLAQEYYKMSLLELQEPTPTVMAYRQALQHINRAIEQEKKPTYLAHKATLLFLLQQEEESLDCFKKTLSLRMDPALRTEIYNNYACALAQHGNREEALKIFEKLEYDKHYLTPQVALVNQAKLYCDQKKYGQAKQKLLEAIDLAPDYLDAQYYLAVVHYRLSEHKDALCAVEKTLQLEPSHRGAQELLAWLRKNV